LDFLRISDFVLPLLGSLTAEARRAERGEEELATDGARSYTDEEGVFAPLLLWGLSNLAVGGLLWGGGVL
jgi:hypothetical protein